MRRARKWAGRLGLAIVVVVAMCVGVLATTPGQGLALRIAAYAASDADRAISLGALDGSVFSSGRLGRLTVRDREGAWLEAREISFSWSPLALVLGRLEIAHLEVGTIEVQRLPVAASSTEDAGGGMPLLALAARRLEIGEVILRAPVAGVPARLHVSGRADLVDLQRGVAATVVVRRLDGPGGHLQARMAYEAEPGLLEVAIDAREPADGLAARVLGLPAQPLALTFTGAGPIDRWRANWTVSAWEQPFVAGSAAIDRVGVRHKLDVQSEAYLGTIVPHELSGVLAGKTVASVTGYWSGSERFEAERVTLSSDALQVTAAGGFDVAQNYLYGTARLRLARSDAQAVRVPLSVEQAFMVEKLDLSLSLPESRSERRIGVDLDAKGVSGAFGSVSGIRAVASARQPAPAGARAYDLEEVAAQANAHGMQFADGGVAAALGPEAELHLTGRVAAGTVSISELGFATAAGVVRANGQIRDGVVSGNAEVTLPDLERLSGLAGLATAGRAVLRASATLAMNGRDLDISLQGTGEGLRAGHAVADRLLAGTTRMSGSIAGDPNGELALSDLTVSNPQMEVQLSGRGGGGPVELDARADVRDLAQVLPGLSGAATITAGLSGTQSELASRAVLETKAATLNGRNLRALLVSFAGQGSISAHTGILKIAGDLDGKPIGGSSRLAFDEASGAAVDDFKLTVASGSAAGGVRIPHEGSPTGTLVVDVPRLADLAPFAGRALAGKAKATITLGDHDGKPAISVRADAPAAQVGTARLAGLTADAQIVDYLAALQVSGTVRLGSLEAAGLGVRKLRFDARNGDGKTRFELAAEVNHLSAALSGHAVQKGAAYEVTLAAAAVRGADLAASLAVPATVSIEGGTAKVGRLAIKTGPGHTEIAGAVGSDAIDLSIALQAVPASLANVYNPGLGLDGVIDGKIVVTGTPAAPRADTNLTWASAASAVTRAQALPPISLHMRARYEDGAANGELRAGGFAGLNMEAKGTAVIDGKGGLDIRIDGEVPLALANGFLAERGGRLRGNAQVRAKVEGALAAPQVSGTVHIENAEVSDGAAGIKLEGVTLSARFTQSSLVIERLAGVSTKGGTITGRGTLSQAAGGAMAVDLALAVAAFKFDDHELMAGEVDADLTLQGSVQSLQARGLIKLKRLDVVVPNQLPRSVAALDLKHVHAPASSLAGRQRSDDAATPAPPMRIALDIGLEAANRIFVKGRGVDAQLGGALRVRGTTDNIIANGSFDMERGRLSVLGRQLDFRHGRLFFAGSTDPLLDMEAFADVDGVTVSVLVTGPASKPTFKFASVPQLPEDETVARLLFNKSLAKLSPVQLAQLAGEIDKIGGLSSGPGVLDQVKGALGVDVFDVTTDKNDDAQVSAGSYVDESTYVGVRQGASASSSRVIVDHDLNKNLKARGELGADGNSKIGIGVEWDY